MTNDNPFPRVVSLACHDLRTPLATVSGFAKTLARNAELGEPASRYVGMIEAAAAQLTELLDELGVVTRIEEGRYDPALRDADTLDLALLAANELGPERVEVSGEGAVVHVDLESTERALAALVRAALRHGGLEVVTLQVDGRELRLAPVTPASRPVLLGEEPRELGAAFAVIVVRAQGGSLDVDGDALVVRL